MNKVLLLNSILILKQFVQQHLQKFEQTYQQLFHCTSLSLSLSLSMCVCVCCVCVFAKDLNNFHLFLTDQDCLVKLIYCALHQRSVTHRLTELEKNGRD